MFKRLREDIDAAISRDPAAHSRAEVLFCSSGLHAILVYRLGHWLWRNGWRLTGRLVSQFGRFISGIEIHPGAKIGRRFFIDHGMGVVIGETSEIGDDVTLYHDVTLGGTSPAVNSRAQVDQKRHPTLMNNVIVGSGAQILGPIVVGEGARVGANAVVLNNVADHATVVGIPARSASKRTTAQDEGFAAYGIPYGEVPDPISRAIEGLLDKVQTLSARVEELERDLAERAPAAHPLLEAEDTRLDDDPPLPGNKT
jgi:serine O-acetyltransferase